MPETRNDRLTGLRARDTDDLRAILVHRGEVLERFDRMGSLKLLRDFQCELIAECREVLAERGAK